MIAKSTSSHFLSAWKCRSLTSFIVIPAIVLVLVTLVYIVLPTTTLKSIIGLASPFDHRYGWNNAALNDQQLDIGNQLNYITNEKKARRSLNRERKGKTQRLITMSLYGPVESYRSGAIENARIVKDKWSGDGWTLRIYHDETIPRETIQQLQDLGTETILVKRQSDSNDHVGTFWRFKPLNTDPAITRLIVRDSDSRLTDRDLMAVREWIELGYLFHVLRDHPLHSQPILAGMWGVVGGFLHPDLVDTFLNLQTNAVLFSADQLFLKHIIWPYVKDYTLTHDNYQCAKYPVIKIGKTKNRNMRRGKLAKALVTGFPTQRKDEYDFVGNFFREENNMKGLALTDPCPLACRRNETWEYC